MATKKLSSKQTQEIRARHHLNFACEQSERVLWNMFLALNDLKEKVEERDPYVVAAYMEILEDYVSNAHEQLSMSRYEVSKRDDA